jgi:hypothetical protein
MLQVELAHVPNRKIAERLSNALSDLRAVMEANLNDIQHREVCAEVNKILLSRKPIDRFMLGDYFKSILDEIRDDKTQEKPR